MMIIILNGQILYLASCLNEDTLVGRSLYDVAESLIPFIKQEVETEIITVT